MKNIHLIPTDKPSKLYEFGGEYHLQEKSQENFRSYYMYITSDEEIKEGDWVVFNELEIVKCTYSKNGEFLFSEPLKSSSNHHFSYFKKNILTTDQDLIKDGVQDIDDDFLEWFVKNPSCEWIDVENYKWSDYPLNYKIIIPKEEPKQEFGKPFVNTMPMFKREPKQETQGYICPQTKKQCDDECCISAEDCHIEASFGVISDCEPPKEETLEEAKLRLYPNGCDGTNRSAEIYRRIFEDGAKWQAERMYSEEEVLQLIINCKERFGGSDLDDYVEDSKVIKWFEQFRKN